MEMMCKYRGMSVIMWIIINDSEIIMIVMKMIVGFIRIVMVIYLMK